jgi:dipeptidyl aminopeptidase/acylaminoacyl peptidase
MMKRCLTLLLLLSAFAAPAPAEGPVLRPGDNLVTVNVPPIPAALAESVERYTHFRTAAFEGWHPTRREMLVGTRFADTNQVHVVRAPGGARTQLTFFPDNVAVASYQPTGGDCFVFSKDRGGDEFFQNYRYDFATGAVTLLTDGKSRNGLGVWSSAGDRMAYGSTRRTGRDVDVWVTKPFEPREDRLVAQNDGGGWEVLDWSPDDRNLLVLEEVSINQSFLWLVDTATGAKTALTPHDKADLIAYLHGRFSRDGKGVYVTTDKDGEFQRLAYLDFATKQITFLTSHIAWDVEPYFDLSGDGKTLAFVTNEAGIGVFHLLDTATGKEKPAPKLPAGIVTGLRWHKNNRDVGFTLSNARTPGDAYSLDASTGELTRWTTSETGGLNTADFPEPELVRWKTFDSREISGFLYPAAKKFTGKRPVVIQIHGGPESQARPGFLARQNYLMNELGVAVIYPNVRGSSGYGKSFLLLDNGFLREGTYKDINALLDWIATRPDLDPERVMVTGGSYGGHMTLAVSTFYSDRIRCSVDIVGISNLVTFLENTSGYRRDLRRVEYGDERDPEMRKFLTKIAPLTNVDKIKKPLFVVQGANDPRVPRSEAEQIVKALQEKGTPVWYLMAKDEGHGFRKKRNADFQFYATVQFMQEYLLK